VWSPRGAWAVRQAQRKGHYDRLPGSRVVTDVTRGRNPVVRWRDETGATGERGLDDLTARERMTLFIEGPRGLEPLWLWLNDQGLPVQVHSWEGCSPSRTGAASGC
jgi:hypothetical protein